jgi:hypothetical protein
VSKGYENTLKAYAKAKIDDLDWYVQRLITVANYDLYFGPVPERFQEDEFVYPGFSMAVDKIKEALDDIGEIYVDDEAELWTETKPSDTENDDEGLEYRYFVSRKDCIKAIVGKELAEYL